MSAANNNSSKEREEIKGLDEGHADEFLIVNGIKFNKRVCDRVKLFKGQLQTNPKLTELKIDEKLGGALSYMAEYLHHWQDKEIRELKQPLESAHMKDVMDEWDAKLVDDLYWKKIEDFFKLTKLANFTGCEPLKLRLCAKFAAELGNTTLDDMEKKLKLKHVDVTNAMFQEFLKKHPEYFAWLKHAPPEIPVPSSSLSSSSSSSSSSSAAPPSGSKESPLEMD